MLPSSILGRTVLRALTSFSTLHRCCVYTTIHRAYSPIISLTSTTTFRGMRSSCHYHETNSLSSSSSSSHTPVSNDSLLECWKCQHKMNNTMAFCPSCKVVQPPTASARDPFHFFDISPQFNIDLQSLERIYKDMQKKLHPDMFASKSESEQQYSAKQSALINQLYQTLRDPVKRAMQLLSMHGVDINEEATIDDVDVLESVMNMRERVERTNNSASLTALQQVITQEFLSDQRDFVEALRISNLREAKNAAFRMVYRNNLLSAVYSKQPVT